MVFKVGQIASLGVILRDRGVDKTKGAIGGKTTQRGENTQPLPLMPWMLIE